jgi:pyrroline-5-carboxylate reductase
MAETHDGNRTRIGIIGAGAMGGTLAAGLLASGTSKDAIRAADPDPDRRKSLEASHGIRCIVDNREVVEKSDLVVLAVKPVLVTGVLRELGGADDPGLARPLWVSVAAGVSLSSLAAELPPGSRLVRSMPNTPALVGEGATAFAANPEATDADRAAARLLFEAVGTAWEAPSEELLDAVTGLSGSGPAYVFLFLEALGDAGERMGLPREAAFALATQTVLGAAKLALESGRPPADLRNQVASPGGTTVAGLERLEAAGFRSAIHDAVEAATRRSRELGES